MMRLWVPFLINSFIKAYSIMFYCYSTTYELIIYRLWSSCNAIISLINLTFLAEIGSITKKHISCISSFLFL